jgi:hypothetical protein
MLEGENTILDILQTKGAREVITTRKAEHQLDDKMPRKKPKDEKITKKKSLR